MAYVLQSSMVAARRLLPRSGVQGRFVIFGWGDYVG